MVIGTDFQIIGAPAFFPTVWGWIKRWFDPVTTSKIFILSHSEVKPTLSSFMDVANIPKQYGGDLDWKWGDMPNLDEPARELIGGIETGPAEGEGKSKYTRGPVLFKGDHIEVLGKVNGESRQRLIPVPFKQDASAENGTISKQDGEKPAQIDSTANSSMAPSEDTDRTGVEVVTPDKIPTGAPAEVPSGTQQTAPA